MCVCVWVRLLSLTQQQDSVAERAGTVGLHIHVEDGSIPVNHADAVVLLGLTEHSQQLVGNEAIQGGDGCHGNQEGQKGVYLENRSTVNPGHLGTLRGPSQ